MNNTRIAFTKMHGIGNDFIVINALTKKVNLDVVMISQLSHRHIGIGFDQLLIIEPSTQADFFCRIYNADGSEAEQCGNGLRCVARYLHENKLIACVNFTLETKAGIFPVEIINNSQVKVNLGIPQVATDTIRLQLTDEIFVRDIMVLALGNPHAIIKVEDINLIEVAKLGKLVSSHAHFPNGTNVGFMQVIDNSHIGLRTYERGAGLTYACGSNACAAVIVGIKQGWLSSTVQVAFSLGSLLVEWQGRHNEVYLTGPAVTIFHGYL